MSRRSGDHDYMMRSEKRPGQRTAGVPRRGRKRPKRNPLYAFFTLLLLVILYPVGLVMLWVRTLRWRSMTKLLLSLVTGVIFFVLVAFALDAPVEQPLLADVQAGIKGQLSHVTGAVYTAISNKDAIQRNLTVEGPKIVNLASNAAARALIRGVPVVSDNLSMLYRRAGYMGVSLVRYVDRQSHELMYGANLLPTPTPSPLPIATPVLSPSPSPTTAPTPDATATPTPGATAAPTLDVVVTPGVLATPMPVVVASPTPAASPTPTPVAMSARTPVISAVPSSLMAGFAPSPSPVAPTIMPTVTPTLRPTPSPTPIVLPEAKPFGEAAVYFFDASQYYHAQPSCQSMNNAPVQTLERAVELNKRRCTRCRPPEASLLDDELVVWCGTDGMFHITDACDALTEQWSGLPIEEAFLEDGMTGCALCGADLYVESMKLAPVATPVPAPALTQ